MRAEAAVVVVQAAVVAGCTRSTQADGSCVPWPPPTLHSGELHAHGPVQPAPGHVPSYLQPTIVKSDVIL